MLTPQIRVDEVTALIAILRNSQKPNIVVEGRDDVIIYRELVPLFGILDIDFHASDGRENCSSFTSEEVKRKITAYNPTP